MNDPSMPDPDPCEPEFGAIATALRQLCHDPLPDLTPATYLDELPGMDSLRVLHVFAMMEEQFSLEIDVTALDHVYQVRDVLHAIHAAQTAAASDTGRVCSAAHKG